MIIYPAIDLRGGRVVRLRHGDPNQETHFGDDPAAMATRWADAGGEWLHVVNLDGAFGEDNTRNREALNAILAQVNIPVQYGGGIRSLDHIREVIDLGVRRVIVGTAAVTDPDFAAAVLENFDAEQIAFALDAKEGKVAIKGWQSLSDQTPAGFGKQLATMEAKHILYTDITRDGDMRGVNIGATADLARETGLDVIASGGVSSLDDITGLLARRDDGIAGVIIGRALYDGAFTLEDALEITEGK